MPSPMDPDQLDQLDALKTTLGQLSAEEQDHLAGFLRFALERFPMRAEQSSRGGDDFAADDIVRELWTGLEERADR